MRRFPAEALLPAPVSILVSRHSFRPGFPARRRRRGSAWRQLAVVGYATLRLSAPRRIWTAWAGAR